jgi:hypothetical protein
MNENNPFTVSRSLAQPATTVTAKSNRGGMGRAACFLFSGLTFVASAICMLTIPLAMYAAVPLLITIFSAIIFARLKNLGYSPWWTVGLLVPVVYPTLWVELLFAPAGYAHHRTLDLPGKLCVSAIIAAVLLMCAALIR